MNTPRVLVLGTHNHKKGEELSELLSPHGFQLHTLADFPNAMEVVEDANTFAGNAERKAIQQAVHLNRWVLGEDSGLSVDALGGKPGVFSARYSGASATDESNNRFLLEQLGGTALKNRTAFYTCHLALSDPTGVPRIHCESYCRGRIRFQPAGSAGFGYDPLFEVTEYHRTFGQLGPAVKSVLSHRARAIRQFVPQLLNLACSGAWDEFSGAKDQARPR